MAKFKDICTKIGSGATPKGGKEAYCEDGISLIRSQNVLDFAFSAGGLAYINELQAEKLKNVIVEEDDVLLNITGDSVARACIVDKKYLPARVNQHVCIIRADSSKAIPSYLLYYLQLNKEYLLQLASGGATRNALTKDMINNLELELPTIKEQQKVVAVLDDIQKKIDFNNAINENLEQQTKALYQSWFVDYMPFEGIIPEGWHKGPLSDLADAIICGKTPSTKHSEYYGNVVPFITIPDMHNQIYAVSTERSLSTVGVASQSGKMLPRNSTCVSCIGTAGLVCMVAEPSQTNQQINSIVPSPDVSPYYIYLLAKTLSDTIQNLGSGGSTICNLNKRQFSAIEVLIPSVESMQKFDKIVCPLFEAIHINQVENLRLAELRDTLLPRLMSGELDVSVIDL